MLRAGAQIRVFLFCGTGMLEGMSPSDPWANGAHSVDFIVEPLSALLGTLVFGGYTVETQGPKYKTT